MMPRNVAQLGSAPDWGSGGRRFKSCHPDEKALMRSHPHRGFVMSGGGLLLVPSRSPCSTGEKNSSAPGALSTVQSVDRGIKRGPERCARISTRLYPDLTRIRAAQSHAIGSMDRWVAIVRAQIGPNDQLSLVDCWSVCATGVDIGHTPHRPAFQSPAHWSGARSRGRQCGSMPASRRE